MPDIEIIVEASLGDSLAKLGLAKHAVDDLGDSGESTGHKLRDFNSSMDDATIASHRAGSAIHDTERLISDAESAITGADNALGGGGGGGGGFISNLFAMGGSAADAQVPLGVLSTTVAGLPVLLVAAATGAVALFDALGTLVAIVGDLVAPLTVVTGLLGLLSAGFVVAATKAFGMHEDGFGKAIAGLKGQFDELTKTLVGRFMPVFQFLIHNAHDALDFLNRIAKLPLNEAFRQLARQGIPAVEQFLGKVGSMVAKPIRLAFQIAFGQGKAGNEAAAAASHLWNQLSDFLFGYSVSHPIRLDGRVISISRRHVDGIFQPLIDWFNRHNFTAQGIRIGHEMLDGFLSSGVAHRMGNFLVQVLVDAAKTAAVGMFNQLERLMGWFLGESQKLGNEFNNALIHAAESAWNTIKGIFSHPLQFVVNVVEHIFGPLSLGSGSVSAPGGGTIPGRAAGAIPPGSSGGKSASVMQTNHFHFHAAGGSDRAAFRRFAHEVGRELNRQQAVVAGGV